MGNPVTQNYMALGGAKWVVGPDGELDIEGMITGGVYVKRYYVDNVTGNDTTGDGLTWDSAYAQVTKAITAWETFRLAQTNVYARGAIFIRGTGVTYNYLTALPNYCDVIGVGADPRGNGAGIVVIGSDGAYNGATGVGGTTDMRGTNWYNIQFVSGNASNYAFYAPIAYRCRFENCTFGTTANGAAGPLAGLYIAAGSGTVIKNCSTVANKGECVSGLKIGDDGGVSTKNFSQCLVEDCVWVGSTNGVLANAYLCDQTDFRHNSIYGASYGIRDTSTETNIYGAIFYDDNYVTSAGTAISIPNTGNSAAQCRGNHTS
ncbi:MAG: hypothetical protein ABSF99_01175 [Anaerolineales bacterium]|jgi:hypothetical protein